MVSNGGDQLHKKLGSMLHCPDLTLLFFRQFAVPWPQYPYHRLGQPVKMHSNSQKLQSVMLSCKWQMSCSLGLQQLSCLALLEVLSQALGSLHWKGTSDLTISSVSQPELKCRATETVFVWNWWVKQHQHLCHHHHCGSVSLWQVLGDVACCLKNAWVWVATWLFKAAVRSGSFHSWLVLVCCRFLANVSFSCRCIWGPRGADRLVHSLALASLPENFSLLWIMTKTKPSIFTQVSQRTQKLSQMHWRSLQSNLLCLPPLLDGFRSKCFLRTCACRAFELFWRDLRYRNSYASLLSP